MMSAGARIAVDRSTANDDGCMATTTTSPAMLAARATQTLIKWIPPWIGNEVTSAFRGPSHTATAASRLLPLLRMRLRVGKAGRSLLDVGREVRELLHLANLNCLVTRGGTARCPLDRLFLRAHLDHPVTAKHLLHLSEGPEGHLGLPAGERNARPHWRVGVGRRARAARRPSRSPSGSSAS